MWPLTWQNPSDLSAPRGEGALVACSWISGPRNTVPCPGYSPLFLLSPSAMELGWLGWQGWPADTDCRDNWYFQAASSWGVAAPPPYLPLGQGWVCWNLLGWFGSCYYCGSPRGMETQEGGGGRRGLGGLGVGSSGGEEGLGLGTEKGGLRRGRRGRGDRSGVGDELGE